MNQSSFKHFTIRVTHSLLKLFALLVMYSVYNAFAALLTAHITLP